MLALQTVSTGLVALILGVVWFVLFPDLNHYSYFVWNSGTESRVQENCVCCRGVFVREDLSSERASFFGLNDRICSQQCAGSAVSNASTACARD